MAGDNYGIQNSGAGDVVNLGVQAFGPHATASGGDRPRPAETVPELLDALRRSLYAEDGELPAGRRAEALTQLDVVNAEVAAPAAQRDRSRITAALAALTTAVGSVATLLTKAEALTDSVVHLIH